MLRSVLSAALLCGAFAAASAQTLAIPEPMAKTYANGTRGMNGKPGKNFWMNHGKYDIAITVNPPHSTVKGVEHITYYNDSPDKLDSLNMKLIINSHRGRNAPEPGTGPSPTDGLQVDNITVNGVKTTWD
jgi:hypothetical protein